MIAEKSPHDAALTMETNLLHEVTARCHEHPADPGPKPKPWYLVVSSSAILCQAGMCSLINLRRDSEGLRHNVNMTHFFIFRVRPTVFSMFLKTKTSAGPTVHTHVVVKGTPPCNRRRLHKDCSTYRCAVVHVSTQAHKRHIRFVCCCVPCASLVQNPGQDVSTRPQVLPEILPPRPGKVCCRSYYYSVDAYRPAFGI